jgi:hypothetical protein
VGIDGFWQIKPSDYVRVQYLRSDTQYPASVVENYGERQRAFGGNALWLDYSRVSRAWLAYGSFESYSPGFRSDSGFVPRVDYTNTYVQGQRRFQRGAGSWFNTIDIGMRGWRSTDSDWTPTDQTVAAFVSYAGPYQATVVFNMPRDIVVYEGVRYEYLRPNFAVGIKPTGALNIQLVGRLGGGVDFANNRKANRALQLAPRIDYRPFSSMSVGFSYDLDELWVDGGRLYRANLVQVRALYHLNVRTHVRAILQYTDISRNTALYSLTTEARSRKLFSQYLFSFKVNPQTVLFAGYSDNALSGSTIDLRRENRTFFVKLGYAWVL